MWINPSFKYDRLHRKQARTLRPIRHLFSPCVQRVRFGHLRGNQALPRARDILGIVILRARKRDLDIVFHIHDEIIVEAKPDQTLQSVEALFSEPISWCRDLPLTGAGYTTPYYLKD